MVFPSYTKTYHSSPYASISPSLPSLSTAGKVVLVTGAGSGIGSSIALSFAASSALALVLLGRTSSSLLAIKEKIKSLHPSTNVLTYTANITDEVAVGKAFSEIQEKFGGVDILVQNAAYMPHPEPIATSSLTEYLSGIDVNVKGNLILTQAFLKYFSPEKKEKLGTDERVIIHVSTAGVHLPAMPPPISAYIVSKVAGVMMMEYLSVELKGKGVRVVSVHPGIQDTAMGEKSATVGLVLPFDDVELPANFMVWAASPEANFLNGKLVWANWDVDELKARKEEILAGPALTLGLTGWP